MNKKKISLDCYKKTICLLLMGVAIFAVNAWTLQKNFYFLFDDIAWIKEVIFNFDVTSFFTVLPQSRYNDRPMRTLFFWVLYQLFKMDYTKYYFVVIIFHIVDSYLLLSIVYTVLKRVNYKRPFECAVICSLFFGMYPKNLMAVYWLAGAANDLLCTFFALLVLLLYLYYMNNRRSYIAMLGSLVAYIFSMRSKEAAICLPLIIFLYECYMSWCEKKKFKVYAGNVLLMIYMVVYVGRIFTLPVGLTGAGRYEQDFSISVILCVLLNYIRMYFGIDDASFSYSIGNYSTKIGELGIIVITIIFTVIVFNLVNKKQEKQSWGIIALFFSSGLALAPLLVLPNVQHLLYFYYPAIFLSTLFGILIHSGLDVLRNKLKYVYPYAMVLMLLIVLNSTGGARTLRNLWIEWGKDALTATKDIENIEPLGTGYHLYLQGAAEGANVFNYGPGNIVNILYNNEDLSIEHFDEETQFEIPYAVWRYSDGHVEEIERVK